MSNLSFILLFCILLVTSPLYSNTYNNNYGTLENPHEGELRAYRVNDGKIKEYDYDGEKFLSLVVDRNVVIVDTIGTFIEGMSHLQKCRGNLSLIWNEKENFYILFSNLKERVTFEGERLSLNAKKSIGITFGKANDVITIKENELCDLKTEIHLYGGYYALIVQNNVSLATVIFNKDKKIYDLNGIESNIKVFYNYHNFKGKRTNIQWLPGNSNDLSFLALSFENQDKVLLGVPLCSSNIGVDKTCYLQFDSVKDVNIKINSLKEDKLNPNQLPNESKLGQTPDTSRKSNNPTTNTQNSSKPNAESKTNDVIEKPPKTDIDKEKNSQPTTIIVVIAIIFTVFVIGAIVVFIFLKSSTGKKFRKRLFEKQDHNQNQDQNQDQNQNQQPALDISSPELIKKNNIPVSISKECSEVVV